MSDGGIAVDLEVVVASSDRVDLVQFPIGLQDATRIAVTASAEDAPDGPSMKLRVHAGGLVDVTENGLDQLAALLDAAADGLRDPQLRSTISDQLASRATFGEG